MIRRGPVGRIVDVYEHGGRVKFRLYLGDRVYATADLDGDQLELRYCTRSGTPLRRELSLKDRDTYAARADYHVGRWLRARGKA